MNKKVIFIGITIVTILSMFSISILAKNTYFPEPVRPVGIPNDAKWDSSRGAYIAGDQVWDERINQYVDKKLKQPDDPSQEVINPDAVAIGEKLESDRTKALKSINQWIKLNKGSNLVFKKEMARFLQDYLVEVQTPEIQKMSFSSVRTSKAYSIIRNLGAAYLSDMKDLLEEGSLEGIDNILEECILGVSDIRDPRIYDTLSAGKTKKDFLRVYNDVIKSSPAKVSEVSKKLKVLKSKNVSQDLSFELGKLGVFALPYVMDEINKGNKELLKYLPRVADTYKQYEKYDKEKFRELQDKDEEFWKQWFKEKLEVIERLDNEVKRIATTN